MQGIGGITDLSWGRSPDEAIIVRCQGHGAQPRCTVVALRLEGHASKLFPPNGALEFHEPDGRLTPWELFRARVSPDKKLLAVDLGGRVLVAELATGHVNAVFGRGVREFVWIPGSRAIAFTQAVPGGRRSSLEEAQLFVRNLNSGKERQLTHFRPWNVEDWNPFSSPLRSYPIVTGLSVASRTDDLAFLEGRNADLYVLSKAGNLSAHGHLAGRCYSHPVISRDASQVAYAAATTRGVCLMAAADEVRLRDLRTGADHVVLSVRRPDLFLHRFDWLDEADSR